MAAHDLRASLDDVDTCHEKVIQTKYSNVLNLHQNTANNVQYWIILFLPPTSPPSQIFSMMTMHKTMLLETTLHNTFLKTWMKVTTVTVMRALMRVLWL